MTSTLSNKLSLCGVAAEAQKRYGMVLGTKLHTAPSVLIILQVSLQ
jgi:hypothetical protein